MFLLSCHWQTDSHSLPCQAVHKELAREQKQTGSQATIEQIVHKVEWTNCFVVLALAGVLRTGTVFLLYNNKQQVIGLQEAELNCCSESHQQRALLHWTHAGQDLPGKSNAVAYDDRRLQMVCYSNLLYLHMVSTGSLEATGFPGNISFPAVFKSLPSLVSASSF